MDREGTKHKQAAKYTSINTTFLIITTPIDNYRHDSGSDSNFKNRSSKTNVLVCVNEDTFHDTLSNTPLSRFRMLLGV